MKHALVTGGSGLVGRHLIGLLLRDGVAVRATVRFGSTGGQIAEPGVETVRWSLDDEVVSPRLLDGIDTVFHLAAPRRVNDKADGMPRRAGGGNLTEGSTRLAAAVAASDAACMVITSSIAVYGKPWGEVDETAPMNPATDYGRDRVATERACREQFAETPGRLRIARLTETFGPGSQGQQQLLTSIAEGRFRLVGDGRVLHHLSTVEDTAAGLLALARTEAASGSVLHIGSRPRTLRDFVSAASDALGQPVRATPWAAAPARALLHLLRAAPPLSRRAAALHAMLDYQLRPRAFSIDRSLELLGDYATSDFEERVAASARAARTST